MPGSGPGLTARNFLREEDRQPAFAVRGKKLFFPLVFYAHYAYNKVAEGKDMDHSSAKAEQTIRQAGWYYATGISDMPQSSGRSPSPPTGKT